MRKKIFTIALSAIMVIAMEVPVLAASPPTNAFIDGYWTLENHGKRLAVSANPLQVLNVYTNAKPQAGNKITTWTKNTSTYNTQTFHNYPVDLAGDVSANLYVPDQNVTVCINVYRSGTSPEVNLAYIDNNYYYDVTLFRENSKIYAKPRAGYGKLYIQVTNENTAASDGYGTSKKCRWTEYSSSGTQFSEQEAPDGR